MSDRLDDIGFCVSSGVDIKNRRIYFGSIGVGEDEDTDGGDFRYGSVQMAIRAIDKMLDVNNKPITLTMSSYGGDPYHMLALLDKMLESPCRFKFYGYGRVSSAATWIMAVADERYLAKNTTVVVHDGSDYFSGNQTDMEIYVEDATRLQQRLNRIYTENSYMPLSFWESFTKRDLFLTAEETIVLGLADAIIPYRGRKQLRKGPREQTFKKKPCAKDMQVFLNDLAKRIKLNLPAKIEVHLPKDEFESIQEYDNSSAVVEKLNNEKPKNNS